MRIRNPKDLGLVIRDRRQQLGLDQASLAKRVGVSRQWVVAVEHGKARAEVGLILRALNALGLDVRVSVADPATDTGTIDAIVNGSRSEPQ